MAQETKIGFSLGWVFLLGFIAGFFRWVYPKKNAGFFSGFFGYLPRRLNPAIQAKNVQGTAGNKEAVAEKVLERLNNSRPPHGKADQPLRQSNRSHSSLPYTRQNSLVNNRCPQCERQWPRVNTDNRKQYNEDHYCTGTQRHPL